jgi:hypothetical protein
MALLDQLLACSKEEKRYLLERLLRDLFGEKPPKETAIYKAPTTPYVYIVEPEHHVRGFLTPERLALWASQDPSKDRPFSEIVAMLERGDENEIRALIEATNP